MGLGLSPTAVRVKPMEDYHILIEFETGEIKKFDVKPYIKGDFWGQLLDEDYFKTVHCNGITIAWQNEQDICPDNIYELGMAYNGEFVVGNDVLASDELSRVKQSETRLSEFQVCILE